MRSSSQQNTGGHPSFCPALIQVSDENPLSMKSWLKRFSLVLGSVVILVALAFFVWRTPQAAPLPNPNGYDDFLRAGKMVTGIVGDYPDLDREALRALMETNEEPLRVLRLGLSRHCAVPIEAAITNAGTMLSDLVSFKRLGQLLAAEGRMRVLDNRPADAAYSYIDTIHLGCEMSHGGPIINRLVGIACEAVGRSALVKLAPQLSCEQTRPLVQELEQINSNEISWDEVLRNEHRYVRAQLGKYPNPIKLVSDLWQARSAMRASNDEHDVAVGRLRLLTVELALRCYRSNQGQAPGRLDMLVPKYLRQVPSDPFRGHPLVFRPQGTNWLLYSVGPDRVDDGGKPVGQMSFNDLPGFRDSDSGSSPAIKGDLFYDSPW
jgi:hypothetical protein